MADSLQTLAQGLAAALEPFAAALSASDDNIAALVENLGYTLPAVPPSLSAMKDVSGPMLDSIVELETRRLEVEVGESTDDELLLAVAQLLLDVGLVVGRIQQLNAQLGAELPAAYVASTGIDQHFSNRLYEWLVIQAVEERSSLAATVLYGLGIFEAVDLPEDPAISQPEFTLRSIRWERIPRLVKNPPEVLSEVYAWGTPDLNVDLLFRVLADLSFALLNPLEYEYPDTDKLDALGMSALVDPEEGPDPELVLPFYLNELVTLSIVVYALPLASPTEARGLAITLRAEGALELEVPISDLIRLQVEAGADLSAGVAAVVRPGQDLTIIENVSSGGAASVLRGARVALRLVYGDEDLPVALLAAQGGSGVFAKQIYLALIGEASGTGAADFGLEAGLLEGKILIQMSGADSFLSSLLPPEGFSLDFKFGMGWTHARGVYFVGSGALETAIPLHQSAGPVTLDTLYLALTVEESGLKLEVSVTGSGAIGPVSTSIERIGIQSALAFSPGNLGPADLGIGFKFPTGLGLAIDAGPISGGGFLSFDPPNGRYAGLLQLELYSISITAIGLLDTQTPDGSPMPPPGFSFLIIITAKFPPIQLSYGFTLNGLGGLAGIHRTVITEALQAGLRTGSVDHILFPEDPERSAPQIISDLRTVFPPAPNRYVFGPMAILGWGTPSLIEAEIGLILELPAPVRLILLGQLSSALPTKETAIVSLHIDVLGILDFEQQSLSIDASLRDSYLAVYSLTGDMALRLSWGASPNFALSVGGLNPHFQPPANFPTLRRLTVSLGLGDNPRISLQAYFAITSNSLQFGAQAELLASYGNYSIYGWVGFDALVIFQPFSFRADLSAGFALRRGSTRLAGIHVSATLTGPAPYHVWGEGCLSLLFFDICVPFDATFGEAHPVALPAQDPWGLLHDAIQDARNWSASLPAGVLAAVSILEPPGGTSQVLVHPMGAASLHQRVLPLNRKLDKFGEFQIEGASRFDVKTVQIGLNLTDDWDPIDDFFAPAQFQNLSDAEKLSRASFEKMTAGITVSSGAVTHGAARTNAIAYETRIVDSPYDSRPAPAYPLPLHQQIRLGERGAKALSGLENSGPRKYAPPPGRPKGFALEDEGCVVVDAATLSPAVGFPANLSQGEALEALEAYLDNHPKDRGRFQVAPVFEIEV